RAVTESGVPTSVTAIDKTYDGTDAASVTSCSLEAQAAGHGVVSPDAVGCVGSNGHFGSPLAGANKTVTGDVVLSGADKDNYQLRWGEPRGGEEGNKGDV